MPKDPLIVIVDDDAAVRKAIASLVESAGFESGSFTSAGKEPFGPQFFWS